MAVLFSSVMNPYAGPGQNNLYRCFIDLTFRLISKEGAAGLIHQDGHLKEVSSHLRAHWYSRVVKHFEFSNMLTQKNFSEVLHTRRFSLNIYRGRPATTSFDQFTSAFVASQIDESYVHDGSGLTPPLRNEDDSWNTDGHRNRLLEIKRNDLDIFDQILGTGEGAEAPRLIQLLSKPQLEAIQSFSALGTISSVFGDAQIEPIFHESGAQKSGLIRRQTHFPSRVEDYVLSGPNIYVCNPLAKSARRECRNHQHYDSIDLHRITEDYLPRTNFRILSREDMPKLDVDPSRQFCGEYRVVFRRRVDISSERSFVSAIIPPGASHIAGVHSLALRNSRDLLRVCAFTSSLPFDFLFRCLGKGDVGISDFRSLPFLDLGVLGDLRVLRLNCLTMHYSLLWQEAIKDLLSELDSGTRSSLSDKWSGSSAFRSDLDRRAALIELDVLAARKLGWSIDTLLDVYRTAFPVLSMNERSTWYDQNGSIVWSVSKVSSGTGFLDANGASVGRRQWESILATSPSELVCTAIDDTRPGGPYEVERRFVGPFFTCDRAEDYKRAWAHFEKLDSENAA